MANKWLRTDIFNPVAKRKSVPNSISSLTRMRWPRPTKGTNFKNGNNSRSTEPLGFEGHNFRDVPQRQSNPNFRKCCGADNNFRICHPKPRKAINLDEKQPEKFDSQSCDINSRLNRQQWFNDNDENDNFTQELEDRIQADLEVERIFWDLPQHGNVSLGNSLPERPGNPIINDQLFVKEDRDNYDSKNNKMLFGSLERITALSQRECSIERQRTILQEDYEAQNEIKELFLSPGVSLPKGSTSFRSLSCSSEYSSFESDFSRPFPLEISLEN